MQTPGTKVSAFDPQVIINLFMTRFRSMPFYLVAVLLHLLFLLIFATYHVASNAPIIISQFVAPTMQKPEDKSAPPPPPPPTPKEQKVVKNDTVSVVVKPTMISVAVPNQAVVIPQQVQIKAPTVDVPVSKLKGHVISAVYGNRLDGKARASAIAKYGGNVEKGEGAVLKALRWLRDNQNDDGSWGNGYKSGITGLALLTFLAHGETQAQGEFKATVLKAVQYLMDFGKKNQNMLATGGRTGYEHAIATYALAENYALTKNSDLLSVLEGAVRTIVTKQAPNGGWDYSYGTEHIDLSISGWNVQALKAAKNGELHVDGLEPCLQKGLSFVTEMYDQKTDRFGYTKRGEQETDALAGVGILCLQFLGEANSKEARGALHTAHTLKCSWAQANGQSSYTWYYLTQAMFQSGGANWISWNKQFRDEIINHQKPDGHWPVPGADNDKGDKNWVTDEKSGPVYHTTLLCMMLEVYYRFLPTFKTN